MLRTYNYQLTLIIASHVKKVTMNDIVGVKLTSSLQHYLILLISL